MVAGITACLSDGRNVFPEGQIAAMGLALEAVDGEFDEVALRAAFEALVASSPASGHSAELTFAVDEVVDVVHADEPSQDLFNRYPSLLANCMELAASRPLRQYRYGSAGRILHEDLLHLHYRRAVLAAWQQHGLESAILLLTSNEFLTNTDLGRWVAETALLTLVWERLACHPADLRRLKQQFPSMKKLVHKVDRMLGKDAAKVPGSDG